MRFIDATAAAGAGLGLGSSPWRMLGVVAVVTVGRLVARPARLAVWLREAAEVFPAVTALLVTYRRERSRWRRPRGRRG
jgi:hypothetical protein